MKSIKGSPPLFVVLIIFSVTACILVLTNKTKAPSYLVFENVIQNTNFAKPLSDSNYTNNMEFLSEKQMRDFGYSLKTLLSADSGVSGKKGFRVFFDNEEASPYAIKDLRNKLILRSDSIEAEVFDAQGNSYIQKMAGRVDSSWFFENVRGVIFKEDWSVDTTNFTFKITPKNFMPLVLTPGKEDLGANAFCCIKPASEQKNFKPITELIISDVFVQQDPMAEEMETVREANTELDFYKLILLMNSTIDKLKSGKLIGFKPAIPFKTQITTAELKSLFTDEFAADKNAKFPVRYKLFNFRFKIVERLAFDPIAFAFKKEALGIVLMKRNEQKDLARNSEGRVEYTFSPVVYVPFGQK